MRVNCLLALILSASVVAAQDAVIRVDAGKVENKITPYLYGACMEDVNHEIYGGIYDQQIFGESFEEPASMDNFIGFTRCEGVWKMQDDQLSVSSHPGAKLVYDDAEFSDGRVGVDIKFTDDISSANNAGLLLRVGEYGGGADNFDGYEVSLFADGKRVLLGKHLHNWQELKTVPVDVDPSQWNRMEVKMESDELVILLNSREVLRFEDHFTTLRNGKVAFRNWGAGASFRNLTIGDGTPVKLLTRSAPQVSGMWDAFADLNAAASYKQVSDRPFHGHYAQQVECLAGIGKVGIANRSLNRWGISVRQGEKKTGSLYLKGKAEVWVALQSVDGEKEYAVQCIRTESGDWKKYTFELIPDKTDENARFAIYLKGKGRFLVDMVTLMNGADRQFRGLPLRNDIGQAMVNQGLRFLRYGGTMVNAPEYRFKNMIGDRALRPPYKGHWYTYSTNGFGIEDFLRFCEKAGFVPAYAVNVEESAQDMADMIEYLNGSVDTEWGKKRAANGHPEPYGLKYLEIGNEEVIWGDIEADYQHYIDRFNDIYEAVHAKDPEVQFIHSAWWRPESPNMEKVFKALDGKAAYWDYHPWTDDLGSRENIDRELTDMKAKFLKWNPNTTMRCAIFEENGNLHNIQRAIVHATVQNVVRRHGDFILTTCAANALQPYLQNDNGWDQGQVFFTPGQVWRMPTFYAQQMSAAHHHPLRLWSEVKGELDVTATTNEARDEVILHVVNTSPEVRRSQINLSGFIPEGNMEIYTLSGELNDENLPDTPTRILPKAIWMQAAGSDFTYSFPAYSYTIVVLGK